MAQGSPRDRRADAGNTGHRGHQRCHCGLPELLEQIPANESIASFSVDGAYDIRDCLDAIAPARGASCDSTAQKRQSLETKQPWLSQPKRSGARLQTLWAAPLESLKRLTPAQFGGNQNALLQALG